MNEILEKLGLSKDELTKTAFELYVSHGLQESMARKEFEKFLEKYLGDINVASLMRAGIFLNENVKLDGDPVELVADELLGMEIAKYIAGSRGVFEFIRYDQEKPGVLSELPPFLDDIVGGLIAGIMSKIYGD